MISPRTLRNLKTEFRRSTLAQLGVVLILLIIATAVFAPFLAPHDPTEQDLKQSHLPPLGFSNTENESTSEMVDGEMKIVNKKVIINATTAHPLGTDSLGRDMLSRVIYGARTSLIVSLLGMAIAAVFGVSIGLVAGYYSNWIDDTLMRTADVMLAFPSLVLAIALVGVWGSASVAVPDPFVALGLVNDMPPTFTLPGTVIIVAGLVNWVWFARVARGEALSIRTQEYIKSANAAGAEDLFIIRKHIFPNSITPVLVLATLQVASVVLLESALSFLGFSGTTLSWGFDIAQGRQYLASSWWIAMVPGVAIVLAVISINLIGDWLRDALDPEMDEGESRGGA
ncbi:ABC transporter permease (plasmid) [Haloferax prahovense]|uniref:ABC transporter permease n=1 Tax=Haloferax prahovense TaxID=381852 RepID=UPI003C72A849